MRFQSLAIVVFVLIGCGQKTTEPEAVTRKQERISGEINYASGVRLADNGKAWVPIAQKPQGEEKLTFEQKQVKPSSEKPFVPVIKIEGPAEDVQAVESMEFHLRNATTRTQLPISEYGMGPFGLTNDYYFGHTFWDMDVWMLPAMLFLDPSAVEQMARYRVDKADQAVLNYKLDLAERKSSGPTFGMKFPWESSVSGKETVIASSKKQIHISGSVLWGLTLANAFGVGISEQDLARIRTGVGNYYRSRAAKGASGLELKDVMSPDENHIGDNDLYTNLIAQWAMNGGKFDGPAKFKLPKDSKSFLTYDNDAERGYKQAAAVLSIFPLQYPEAEAQAKVMIERFEGKVIKNGPAMTDAIHSIVWARIGEPQKAYMAWHNSWKPFIDPKTLYFSEKRSTPRTYFYTGAAGSLNAILYGFCGLKIEKVNRTDNFKLGIISLGNGWSVSLKPHLPTEWKSVELRSVWVGTRQFNIKINSTNQISIIAK